MKTKWLLITLLFVLIAAGIAAPTFWFTESHEAGAKDYQSSLDDDPDLPPGLKISKDEYLRLRNEQLTYLLGLDTAKPDSRGKAIRQMQQQEQAAAAANAATGNAALIPGFVPKWRPLGPSPIPVNASTSYSGRVSAIAVDPGDPNIVYVGTAQGGLYRSFNGGTTWTPLFDNALSLAIGAIAIAPSDPSTVFVGTGEPEFSADSFFGVGIYRITNANNTNDTTIAGPFNLNAGSADIFTGRAVSEIIVHPTDPNTLFVSTCSGIAGIGGTTNGLTLPNAGVYRTTNAMATTPTFAQLTIQGTAGASRSVSDLVIEPGNPNHLIAGVVGSGGDGGVYVANDALSATPTFTRTLTTGDGATLGRTELATHKDTGTGTVTVFAATGTSSGTLFKSTDGGATFPTSVANSFCGGQCFYDMAIAVDQTDVNKVYLGGSPNLPFGRSTNAGGSFANNSTNLHVDTQAIAIAPSNTKIVYFGSDGGVWKTTDVTTATINWTSLNPGILATQFQGIALHPLLRNYTLGGTQDNGTEFLAGDRTTWVRSDGGDGGFSAIDRNATTPNNVVAYHTYFNSSGSQIGFTRATSTVTNGDPIWSGFLGCGGTANGINCADATLFYAPMVVGPNATDSSGTNTLYFGTTHLYRSGNQGTAMTDVSGLLPGTDPRISAIAIAPQDDNVRLVGTRAGTVFLSTTAGATTMTPITGSIPARYVGRVAIDPTNSNVAYVCLNGFGLAAGQHIWKTTNLLGATPTWSASGNGIPDVPVNAFAVDPANNQTLYAGTDIGVYRSTDGGANWAPFSVGLPRVAVFGMEFQAAHRVLRISTHGKGVWEFDVGNEQTNGDFDGDARSDVAIFRPSDGTWWYQRSFDGVVNAAQFGQGTDKVVAADFTGDGKVDIAFWRPTTGQWFILRSEDGSFFSFPFGTTGDIPMPADYDGDGKADAAVFRPSNGTWFILRSSDGQVAIIPFGQNGDLPVAGDYDGDGLADVAIFRPSGFTPGAAEWWVLRSSSGVMALQFGSSTDKAVPGDFTGDGKTDVAFFRPSTNSWFVLRSEDFSFFSFPFGAAGDIPAPGDYDGDGKTDAAVFRPSTATWIINRSTLGPQFIGFGLPTDQPVENAIVR